MERESGKNGNCNKKKGCRFPGIFFSFFKRAEYGNGAGAKYKYGNPVEKISGRRSSGTGIQPVSDSRAKGIILLIGALLLFQIITFTAGIFRSGNPPGNEYKEKIPETERKDTTCFGFNPNTITKDSLVLLGFTPKQAQTIINYREKGGRFRKREDFAKMYVVSDEKYALLEKRIFIPAGKETELIRGKSVPAKENIRDGKILKNKVSLKRKWSCNLNTADSSELIKLYGIGPYFASKILKYRDRLGGSFAFAGQLLEIDGIDTERFGGFKDKLIINPRDIKRFSIDEMKKDFMERHPYIGPYAARGILFYRERKKEGGGGKITLDELIRENIISPQAAEKLIHYID